MDAAEAAVRETLARARRIYASGAVSTVAILREADSELSAKLHQIVERHGGADGKFSHATAQLYRKQIQLATGYLEKRLAGHTHTQAMRASGVALRDTVKVAKALERKYTGIAQPLKLEQQQVQDAALRGSGASLLRRHQASFDRYGKAMVGEFERVMRGAQLQGLTHEQVVSRLVEAGELGGHNARSLHENEPGYFPEPTSYVKRRYWAERIVRTELAYAANSTALQGMHTIRQTDFPDVQKKILATFDQRTAPDSVAVHGQVRKLEEMFMDGAGRQYLHPPGRPNDRETVIPWRPHWKENPATKPPPPAEVAKAEVDSQPNPDAEARRDQLRGALARAKARVLERQKHQAQADATVRPATAAPSPHVRLSAAAERRAEVAQRRAAQAAARAARQGQLAAARERAALERASKAMLRRRKAEEKAQAWLAKKGPEITTNEHLERVAKSLGLTVEGDIRHVAHVLGRNLRESELGELTGAKALRKLGKVTGTFRIRDDSIRYGVEAGGGSNTVGGADLARTITRKPEGPEVYHSFYFTHESAQGSGVGAKALRGMFQTYKDLGVKSVGVSAVDVGQYYWPKIGFVAEPELVASLKADFRHYLERDVGMSREAAGKWVGKIKSAHDIANTDIAGYRRARTKADWQGKFQTRQLRAGQDFLIHGRHDSLSGLKMTLKEGDPGWEICKAELGIK